MDAELIRQREEKLKAAANQLKRDFVDLDETIDQVVSCVKAWFVMPELIQRPVVVCLWGTTGVGKTALTRRLAELLLMRDRMFETTGHAGRDEDGDHETLERRIEYSDVPIGEPGILLIDEVQYLRTIDCQGAEKHNPQLQPLWDMLSDGCLRRKSNTKSDILSEIEDLRDLEEEPVSDGARRRIRHIENSYEARKIKNLCRLPHSVEDIRTWPPKRRIEALTKALDNPATYAGLDYSKLLIFVVGNMEEIFQGSDEVANPEVDSDFIRAKNRDHITTRRVRDALSKRFRPEQVARLGSNHIVFPVPGKGTFAEIAKRHLDEASRRVMTATNVDVRWEGSVVDMICRNGAYAAQGVRPLVSTAASLVSAAAPKAVECCKPGEAVLVCYDNKERRLVGHRPDGNLDAPPLFALKYEGCLDLERDTAMKRTGARLSMAVHEAGHIVAMTTIWKTAPRQSVLCGSAYGWVDVPISMQYRTRQMMMEDMVVAAAGLEAEIMVFGDMKVTAGVRRDIETMTALASELVRMWGTEKGFPTRIGELADEQDTDVSETNDKLKELVGEARNQARLLLKKGLAVLADLTEMHLEKYILTSADIVACHARHGRQLATDDEDQGDMSGRAREYLRWKSGLKTKGKKP